MIERKDLSKIKSIFSSLGLQNQRVCLHTSFKSLRSYCASPELFVRFCQDYFQTVLVPGFCSQSTIGAPTEDRPMRNGMDYTKPWISDKIPHNKWKARVDKNMGVISHLISEQLVHFRSDHPFHMWIAVGDDAETICSGQTPFEPNLPLQKLMEMEGYVVLIGVDYNRCTALHLAEEHAGRPHLVRWFINSQGQVERMFMNGCADWAYNLRKMLDGIFYFLQYDSLTLRCCKIYDLVKMVSKKINENSEICICPSRCLRCMDLFMGGPY